jgi:hypothetical protein
VRSTTGRRGTRRLVGALAACVLLATVLAGCTSARSGLGTSDSSCYLALPTAAKAVEGHGRLLGVHLFTLTALQHKAPNLFKKLATSAGPQRVCVIAFEGHFDTTTVSTPLGRPSGRLAVVVSTIPANHLLGTVIFTRAPLHFGHPHIG